MFFRLLGTIVVSSYNAMVHGQIGGRIDLIPLKPVAKVSYLNRWSFQVIDNAKVFVHVTVHVAD